jgi:transposase
VLLSIPDVDRFSSAPSTPIDGSKSDHLSSAITSSDRSWLGRFDHARAKLVPCLVGMEACAGAHYWARKLSALGHTVKLITPQFVKPYVKGNKNDARNAEAICEAVSRPTMRFVPVKTVEQQAVLSLH